ncbi:hypothetical protein UFOVP586_51 [uncultured Caudovirales phage]|uniref:Uncharacterized protein n=1 Tax=uncultured Caudovirales phage TaxID=2100421 RepID=A0A6J5N8V2_9CAUD|nr:hypothetical protein UFOVP586_51 [uncultured Caudovirales phage]
MNRLDLIIDALYKTKLLFEAHGQYPHTLREINEALAAARELKALKPVAVRNKSASAYMEFSSIESWDSSIPTFATLLYALDGEQA